MHRILVLASFVGAALAADPITLPVWPGDPPAEAKEETLVVRPHENRKIEWVTKPALHDGDPIDKKVAEAAAKAILKLPGDPKGGKDIVTNSCNYCHAMKEKKVGPAFAKIMDDPQAAVRSIRVGSGAMPFYGKDILTDQQVADVIAYLQQELGK